MLNLKMVKICRAFKKIGIGHINKMGQFHFGKAFNYWIYANKHHHKYHIFEDK